MARHFSAIHSDEYVKKLAGRQEKTAAEKKDILTQILRKSASESHAIHKIGQGMIGPIQVRLRYEGMTRSVLIEDTLERGPLMPYDILDDLGQAYILSTTGGEVRTQLFEGKQAPVTLFRIASFPRVKKEDLYFLRVNIVEFAQDESRQAIMKQEDYKLITLLESAIVAYGQSWAAGQTVGGVQTGISSGPTGLSPDRSKEKTVLVGSGAPLEPIDFYSAVTMVEIEQLEANRLLAHPQDIRDLYTWDINTTGFAFKDKVVGGEKITSFGEFEISRSVLVPQGEVFLVPKPDFLGVFPVMYSLDVEENHQIETFMKGWVMDEMVGMLILNARGLARIVKADTYSSSTIYSVNLANRGLYF